VAHHVFPGNTADITAFRQALGDLRKRFLLRRVVVIADRRMVSADLMEELERDGGKDRLEYIFGMRLRQGREVSTEMLAPAGPYHKAADNLQVKAVRGESVATSCVTTKRRRSETLRCPRRSSSAPVRT